MVPVVGLEPTRGISPTDFESVTSTIPSHRPVQGYYKQYRCIFQVEKTIIFVTFVLQYIRITMCKTIFRTKGWCGE